MSDKPIVSVVIPTHNRKSKLVRLVDSIYKNDYSTNRLEVIVVDDCSSDGTSEEVIARFPLARIIRNETELLSAGSKNVGVKTARGKYIFLVDDDNILDKNCISELVKVFENSITSLMGIVAPVMYYSKQPNRMWCAGIERNMITSRTKFIGKNEIDIGQFSNLIKSEDFPNAFMIEKRIVEKVGLFDESNFPIHYEEADFGERVRRAGYRVVCNPEAKIWHDIPLPEEVENKTRHFHCDNPFRAYYCGKNRIIFHRKYSKWWQFLIFISIFNWFFTFYYMKVILTDMQKDMKQRIWIAMMYLKGVFEGILYEADDI